MVALGAAVAHAHLLDRRHEADDELRHLDFVGIRVCRKLVAVSRARAAIAA